MNKIYLIGRVGTEPKIKEGYCNIRIAVDHTFKKKNGEKAKNTEWFSCVGFQTVGDNMGDHISLGDLIRIEGRMQSSKYQDTSGTNRTSWSVIVETFEIVRSPEKVQHPDNYSHTSYTRTRDNIST